MENVIIDEAVVIKEVKQDKAVLKEFLNSLNGVNGVMSGLDAEMEALEGKVQEAQSTLEGNKKYKEDIQALITKGNGGLVTKLIESQKNIDNSIVVLEACEKDRAVLEGLQEEQAKTLEKGLYSDYMASGKLVNEYNTNAKRLQLQYYSLLYKAFEVEKELEALSNEYANAVKYSFDNAYPYKDFTTVFNYNPFINGVRENFPQPRLHQNVYSSSRLQSFVDSLGAVPESKEYKVFK